MSISVQVVRTLCLMAAVGCGAAPTNISGDASAAEIRVAQSIAIPSKSQADNQGIVRLAVVTPSLKDHDQARRSVLAEPFGLHTMPLPPGEISAKWAELQTHIRSDQERLAACRSNENDCPAAARAFLQIIEQGRKREGRARIGEINRAINLSIKPMADSVQHGIADVWSAPLATFASGAGDCEDYAIAKYLALRESGTVSDDLRLVIVRDVRRRTDHAVVAVHFEGEWLLLDNRHLVLVKPEEAPYYRPLFVMDQRGVAEFNIAELRR
jgi:predicted transglutaminase-like cysteine proteinase